MPTITFSLDVDKLELELGVVELEEDDKIIELGSELSSEDRDEDKVGVLLIVSPPQATNRIDREVNKAILFIICTSLVH
jgi:hypothetical protein